MAVNIVTGMTGIAHITSDDDRIRNAATFGNGQFVFSEIGSAFKAEKINNNQIRIRDGMLMNQGTQMGIEPDDYEDVVIDNGTVGTYRNDLIVMRYEKNVDTARETANLVVIKGTIADSDPTDPEYTTGNILDGGDLISDMPLYRVKIEGLSLAKIEPLFDGFTYNSSLSYMGGKNFAAKFTGAKLDRLALDTTLHNSIYTTQKILMSGTLPPKIRDLQDSTIMAATDYALVVTIMHNTTNTGMQYIFPITRNYYMAQRSYVNNTWQAWQEKDLNLTDIENNIATLLHDVSLLQDNKVNVTYVPINDTISINSIPTLLNKEVYVRYGSIEGNVPFTSGSPVLPFTILTTQFMKITTSATYDLDGPGTYRILQVIETVGDYDNHGTVWAFREISMEIPEEGSYRYSFGTWYNYYSTPEAWTKTVYHLGGSQLNINYNNIDNIKNKKYIGDGQSMSTLPTTGIPDYDADSANWAVDTFFADSNNYAFQTAELLGSGRIWWRSFNGRSAFGSWTEYDSQEPTNTELGNRVEDLEDTIHGLVHLRADGIFWGGGYVYFSNGTNSSGRKQAIPCNAGAVIYLPERSVTESTPKTVAIDGGYYKVIKTDGMYAVVGEYNSTTYPDPTYCVLSDEQSSVAQIAVSVSDLKTADYGAGVNLLDFERFLNENNLPYTKSGETYTITAIDTNYTLSFSDEDIDIIFSGKIEDSSGNPNLHASMYIVDKNGQVVANTGYNVAFEISGKASEIRAFGYNNATGGATFTVTNPMIRPATILDDTFYPYIKTNKMLTQDVAVLPANAKKNILNFDYAIENKIFPYSSNGITMTLNEAEGTVTLNGTTTSKTTLSICFGAYDAEEVDGYIASGFGALNGITSYGYFSWRNSSGGYVTEQPVGGEDVVLKSNGNPTLWAGVHIMPGESFSNAVLKPMIRPAGTSPDFVPYMRSNLELTHDTDGVRGVGRNLLPNDVLVSGTGYGLTWTVTDDGVVTINGTQDPSAKSFIFLKQLTIEPGDYILSGCPSSGGEDKYYLYDDKHYIQGHDTGNGVRFTLTESRACRIYICVLPGVTVSNAVFKPMIRSAKYADDPTYYPYSENEVEFQSKVREQLGEYYDIMETFVTATSYDTGSPGIWLVSSNGLSINTVYYPGLSAGKLINVARDIDVTGVSRGGYVTKTLKKGVYVVKQLGYNNSAMIFSGTSMPDIIPDPAYLEPCTVKIADDVTALKTAVASVPEYEEGTWTPTFPNLNEYQNPIATYKKVGKIVHINIDVSFQTQWGVVSDTDLSYTDFNVSGLPFAANGYNMQIEVGLYGNSGGYGILCKLFGAVSNNQTIVRIQSGTRIGQKKDSDLANVTSLNIEGFYESKT